MISKKQLERAKKFALKTLNQYGPEIKTDNFLEKMIETYHTFKVLPELKLSSNKMVINIAVDALAFYRSLDNTISKERKLVMLKNFANHWMDGQFDRWIARFFYANRHLHKMFRLNWFKKANKTSEADGQKFEIVENVKNGKKLFYGVNVVQCGIVKFLKNENALEIAPILCDVDFYITKYLPNDVEFRRTQIIATGAPYCDFRYFFKKYNKDHFTFDL